MYFLYILSNCKKCRRLTKNWPKIGKLVLNEIIFAIFSSLRLINLIKQYQIHVRNFCHFRELFFFFYQNWVFSFLILKIQISEISMMYSTHTIFDIFHLFIFHLFTKNCHKISILSMIDLALTCPENCDQGLMWYIFPKIISIK